MSKYPKVLYQFEQSAGKPFQPSNGTEGMVFTSAFCDKCIHDRCQKCKIVGLTMVFDPSDEEYPEEWIYSDEGWPICTKFQRWDGNEPPEKQPEPIDDPDQLMLPFMVNDVIETETVEKLVTA